MKVIICSCVFCLGSETTYQAASDIGCGSGPSVEQSLNTGCLLRRDAMPVRTRIEWL